MNLAVLEDHPVVRSGIIGFFKNKFGDGVTFDEMKSVKEFSSRLGQSTDLMESPWDCVLLDLSLEDGSGLDALAHLKAKFPKTPALILSMHSEAQYVLRVARAGASGYLEKSSSPEVIAGAIEKVMRGETAFSPKAQEYLTSLAGRRKGIKLPHELLSEREMQVLLKIGTGRTPTEIAKELNLSVKTVSTYRTRILEKLGLETTSELILYVVNHALV